MRALLKASAMAIVVCLNLVACTEKEKIVIQERLIPSPDEKIVIPIEEQMDSDQLTSSAEQLFGPFTYMLSYHAASLAIAKNPNNIKAQFYYFLSRPLVLTTKGIHARLRPLATKAGDVERWDKWIKDFPESPMKKFLADGKEDISSLTDWQTHQDLVAEAWGDLRKFLIKNQNAELTLYLNPHLFEDAIRQNMGKNCVVKEITLPNGQKDYKVECDFLNVATMKVNIADLYVLQQMAAGMVAYYGLINSYSLEGAIELSKMNLDKYTSEAKQRKIESMVNLGKLRKTQKLSQLPDLGADYVGAIRWALKYQKELCREGHPTFTNRKGYLFETGICLNKWTEKDSKDLDLAERATKEAVEVEATRPDGKIDLVKLDYAGLYKKPPQDLRSIAPAKWDKCDQVTALRDNSFGGLFPDSNADKWMLSGNKDCSK